MGDRLSSWLRLRVAAKIRVRGEGDDEGDDEDEIEDAIEDGVRVRVRVRLQPISGSGSEFDRR